MKLFIPRDETDLLAVVKYLTERVRDFESYGVYAAMASIDCNRIIGAVVYQNYRSTDIEMVCAGEPGWLNRSALRAYFSYPYVQLKCRRTTVVCHRKNKHARAFVERLGWRLEGVHRKAMPDGGDAISYGMLREDCPWIKGGENRQEIRAQTAAAA